MYSMSVMYRPTCVRVCGGRVSKCTLYYERLDICCTNHVCVIMSALYLYAGLNKRTLL